MNNIIILNDKLKDKENLEQRVETVFNHVAKTFNGQDLSSINILFHTSRLSFDGSLGRKTCVWEVGNTSKDNKIDIIHPDFFAKISSHSDSEFDQILAHEIAHIFINKLAYGCYLPFWLNEGLAMNIAGQVDKYKTDGEPLFIEEKFTNHLASKKDWDDRVDVGAYKIACLFTAFLIEKFALDKILELIAKTERNYYAPHFEKKIVEILGKSIRDLENDFVLWN